MLKDNWKHKHDMKEIQDTHVGNMMRQPLQSFSDNQPITHHPFDNQNHESETQKPTDNACSMQTYTPDAEKKPIIPGSNMQDLIKILSANYGPMKTPLEMGTPEYMRLVEILQQSGSSFIPEKKEIINKDDEEKVTGNGLKTDEKKLWEGSLQLSSSVTLLATAFFKSGEKLVGNKWPESIEVKGKVRLEAFEKYVKDLPRSRNRGLMVISVCWKEGSSNTGLTGMKEVAKGYKKSSRVGFAQLVSGIDLYICPRSDPIITILAKYGFFKGMSVLDDKQDSMIGCVVWRKNRPSNPTNKTSDNNKSSPDPIQPPNPKSESLTLPLTSNIESNKNMLSSVDVDHNNLVVNSSSNCSSSDSGNLGQKRVFQDNDDDLPEFDFGIKPVVNSQKMDNSQSTQLTENVKRNVGDASLDQSSKKSKLFDDDDMPEWCPPTVRRQVPPQNTTPNFQNLPSCPPRPPLPPLPIPPPPRVDTRPLFSYQPFRPALTSLPPTFMAAPPLPPPPQRLPPPPPPPRLPPPPPSSSGMFSSNQGMWHQPGSSNDNPLFPSSNRRPPQPW